jgi:signal transduction histidine kinase
LRLTPPNSHTVADRISAYASIFLILGGLAVIVGWQFRIPSLRGEFLGTFVAPNTALLFVLAGTSLLLGVRLRGSRAANVLSQLLGAFVMICGALVLFESVSGTDLGIDAIFMAHRLGDWYLPIPAGRFAWTTATVFVCAGAGLLGFNSSRSSFTERAAMLVLLIAIMGISGRAYGITSLYARWMSPQTAVLCCALGTALLFGARRRKFAQLALSKRAGGMLARRLLPVAILMIPLLGWFHLWAPRYERLGLQAGTALFVLTVVLLITIIIISTAHAIDNFDRKRVLAEMALRDQEKLAATGRMAATIAHEINNPLEAVMNLVYLAEADPNQQTSREYLRLAQQELERVAHIAKQTLAFYREASQPEIIDLAGLVDEVLFLLGRRLEKKAAHVVVQTQPGLPAMFAVKGELRQIVSNVLTNAIDAVPLTTGTVKIAITSDGQHVTLEVSDNGCGIPADVRDRIFDPFYSTKKEFGTGLGLWITRQLVEKNHGTIMFVSDNPDQHDVSTSFFIRFPAADAHAAHAASSPTTAA